MADTDVSVFIILGVQRLITFGSAQVRTAERFNQQLTLKHALLKWSEARNILKVSCF